MDFVLGAKELEVYPSSKTEEQIELTALPATPEGVKRIFSLGHDEGKRLFQITNPTCNPLRQTYQSANAGFLSRHLDPGRH